MSTLWVLSQFFSDPVSGIYTPVAADYASKYSAPSNPLPITTTPAHVQDVAGTYNTSSLAITPTAGNSLVAVVSWTYSVSSSLQGAGPVSGSSATGTGWSLNSGTGHTGDYVKTFTASGVAPTLTYAVEVGVSSPIPSGAVIQGITVTFSRAVTGTSTITFDSIAVGPTGHTGTKSPAESWTHTTPSYTSETFGSNSDLWGTTWTPAQINDGSFGVSFNVECSTFTTSTALDIADVTVEVAYTVPTTVTPPSLPTVSDSQGNAWGALDGVGLVTTSAGTTVDAIALFYAANVAGAATTVTATAPTGSTSCTIGLSEFSGISLVASHGTDGSSINTDSGDWVVITAAFGTNLSDNSCALAVAPAGFTSTALLPGGGTGAACAVTFAYNIYSTAVTGANIDMTDSGQLIAQTYGVFQNSFLDGTWGLVKIEADPQQVESMKSDPRIVYCGTNWSAVPSEVFTVYTDYLTGSEALMGSVLDKLSNTLDPAFMP